eukprot:CAMPEP_0206216798 /NCGR_PEP_ID=MMETSP0047_2-20121206/2917_1 /ASSEMBLY_ACC=CAM_ASM_000192 /TAXON_ID=195065 /ORGANISM="Chroomonas mesostigmatica_cf, Strain CCMP1168" /LENGTH=39 /DNA_ID= /DNA_START= /DNA_END= /DNA_ORIENTATION=
MLAAEQGVAWCDFCARITGSVYGAAIDGDACAFVQRART